MLDPVEFGARLRQCIQRVRPVVENVSGKGFVDASAAEPAIAPSWRIKDSRCPDESTTAIEQARPSVRAAAIDLSIICWASDSNIVVTVVGMANSSF